MHTNKIGSSFFAISMEEIRQKNIKKIFDFRNND